MINRTNFGTSTVIGLLKSNSITYKESLRLLEEACHVIIELRERRDSILKTIAVIQNELEE